MKKSHEKFPFQKRRVGLKQSDSRKASKGILSVDLKTLRRAVGSPRRAQAIRVMAFKPRRVNIELRKVGTPGCAALRGWRLHEVYLEHYYYA
jgi:hypothetical protein